MAKWLLTFWCAEILNPARSFVSSRLVASTTREAPGSRGLWGDPRPDVRGPSVRWPKQNEWASAIESFSPKWILRRRWGKRRVVLNAQHCLHFLNVGGRGDPPPLSRSWPSGRAWDATIFIFQPPPGFPGPQVDCRVPERMFVYRVEKFKSTFCFDPGQGGFSPLAPQQRHSCGKQRRQKLAFLHAWDLKKCWPTGLKSRRLFVTPMWSLWRVSKVQSIFVMCKRSSFHFSGNCIYYALSMELCSDCNGPFHALNACASDDTKCLF